MSRGGEIVLMRLHVSPRMLRFEYTSNGPVSDYLRGMPLELASSRWVVQNPSEAASVFFLAMAPLAWMTDARLRTSVDAAVTDTARACIESVGDYVCSHYSWRGRLPLECVPTTLEHRVGTAERVTGIFMSGGVDSLSAWSRERGKIRRAISVRNFDNLDEDLSSKQRSAANGQIAMLCRTLGRDLLTVRTNLSDVLKHRAADHWFPAGCSFWYGLQHVNHLAVAAAAVGRDFGEIVLAGSFDKLHDRVGSCAARAAFVDRYQQQWGLRLAEEGTFRQHKIENLISHAPKVLRHLRVCFLSGDRTCLVCEKCIGTALMVVTAGFPLVDTSFPPGIVPSLARALERLERIPGKNPLLEHALLGRRLSGPRHRRLAQLRWLVAASWRG